ncbi:MAG: hypothetical protein RJA70_633 [Pseudomonadota bacterium]|jgi:NADPH:quinone reductase-like Zn-dependent oxidoreductase
MKVASYACYGGPEVVQVVEQPQPEPTDNEVLIQVVASTVSAGDWRARSLVMPPGFGVFARPVFGFSGPRQRVLGMDLAGRIAAVGKRVTEWQVGDEVVAHSGMRMGCHAQYVVLRGDAVIVRKPLSLSFEAATSLVFGAGTAWAFLLKAKVTPGERVAINGASGAVGSAAVQLAKHLGAHVTAVSSQVDCVRALGADRVVDYQREDFAVDKYDVILDCVGTAPWSRVKRSLNPGGRLLLVVGRFADLFLAPWISRTTGFKMVSEPTSPSRELLTTLAGLATEGVCVPLIDEVFALEAVAEAHRRVDSGHKRGNVVLAMTDELRTGSR